MKGRKLVGEDTWRKSHHRNSKALGGFPLDLESARNGPTQHHGPNSGTGHSSPTNFRQSRGWNSWRHVKGMLRVQLHRVSMWNHGHISESGHSPFPRHTQLCEGILGTRNRALTQSLLGLLARSSLPRLPCAVLDVFPATGERVHSSKIHRYSRMCPHPLRGFKFPEFACCRRLRPLGTPMTLQK